MTDPGSTAPADDVVEPAPPEDAPPAAAPVDEPAALTAARPPHRMRTLALVGLVVVVADQVTKAWAQRAMADGHDIHVIGSLLKFTLSYNSGMAFSKGTGLGPYIGVLALVVVVVLLGSLRKEASRFGQVVLAIVVGGAAGNIVDRLFRHGGFMRGSVVDFIELPHWPVFNVADMAVSLGGITLVAAALLASRRSQPPS